MRFNKRVKIAKGVNLNIGKRGVGISAGVKGARIGVSSSGKKYSSVGIPGTGVSYRTTIGSNKKTPVTTAKTNPKSINSNEVKVGLPKYYVENVAYKQWKKGYGLGLFFLMLNIFGTSLFSGLIIGVIVDKPLVFVIITASLVFYFIRRYIKKYQVLGINQEVIKSLENTIEKTGELVDMFDEWKTKWSEDWKLDVYELVGKFKSEEPAVNVVASKIKTALKNNDKLSFADEYESLITLNQSLTTQYQQLLAIA